VVSCAALGDLHPGALQTAVDDLPRRAVKHFEADFSSFAIRLKAPTLAHGRN